MSAPIAPMTVEDRLTALEHELSRLKMEFDKLANPKGNWVERISGSMKDIPEDVWREYQECCREARRDADRPVDDTP